MPTFKDRLSSPGVLVADGATGTMLQRAGLPRGIAPERWNLDNPDAVRTLYKSYAEAGADIILTNTFGGTGIRLEREDLHERVHEVNLIAARLAREVAGKNIYVFGDMGPMGKLLKPLGPIAYDYAINIFAEQAAGLDDGKVDAILIETMSDLNEAKAAIEGVRKATDLPILVTFSFDTRGRTMMGLKPETVAREIWDMGVAGVGANCGRTLNETLAAIQAMRQAVPEAVLMAKPNAGLPHTDNGDLVYDVTPEVMVEYAHKFVEQGVKIFGGCCGSTPEHIQAIARALKNKPNNIKGETYVNFPNASL
jgi:5-methyltetrahydrofolate--homocysteine methyltransferase